MKIDCNVTENFLREKNRMTKACTCGCPNCAIYRKKLKPPACMDCHVTHAKEAIEIVQKWSDAHPRKTILSDLLEKYPKVMLGTSGIPDICPRVLGYAISCAGNKYCSECWNQEMEEGAHE